MSQTEQIPVTTVEYIEMQIIDEAGVRTETRARYSVAEPDLNPARRKLADLIVQRRGTKESLSRSGMASAVSAADEFSKLENPTISNRKHYASCLKAAGLSPEEAEQMSGMAEYLASLKHFN